MLEKIFENKLVCIILGIIFLILASVFRNDYKIPGACIIFALICFALASTTVAKILESCLKFIINIILKIITLFIDNLENKSILFILVSLSVVITIAAFYAHSTDIWVKPCPYKTIYCLFAVDKVLKLTETLGFVLSIIGIFFLLPQRLREKLWYYISEFPQDCERKYLIPLIIVHACIILIIPYLFFTIAQIPDFSLSPEQFTICYILLGLLMIIMLGIEFIFFQSIYVALKRLFYINDIDYKGNNKRKGVFSFLYGKDSDSEEGLDTFLKDD